TGSAGVSPAVFGVLAEHLCRLPSRFFMSRQHDAKDSSPTDFSFEIQPSAMPIDDPGRDRQPEARSLFLGAEERFKQPRLHFRANARSVVFHFNEGNFGRD